MDKVNYENAKIVVIDDTEAVLEAITDALEFENMQVKTFANPIEGLEYLKTNKADVLLLDYYMPEMNGDELIGELRKYNKETIIILQTGYADKIPPLDMIDKLNIQGYIDKNEGTEKLILAVKSAIKTSYMYKQINALEYKNEFSGKFLNRLIGEARERFFIISSLFNKIADEEERKNFSDEEMERYTGHVKEAINKFMKLVKSLDIGRITILSNKELKEILQLLFEINLKDINSKININDGEQFIAFDCDAKNLIYILVDVVEFLLDNNEKEINISVEKVVEKVEIKIDNEIESEELIDKLEKLARFDDKIQIFYQEKRITIIIG